MPETIDWTTFKCGDCRPCDTCKGEGVVKPITPTRAPDGRFVAKAEEAECPRCEGAARECGVWQAPMCAITETCTCECAD